MVDRCRGAAGEIEIEIPGGADDETLGVGPKIPPSNPNFQCSLITQCDAPAFTALCVPGGEAFMNSTRDCTVAVEESSWSEIKSLYN